MVKSVLYKPNDCELVKSYLNTDQQLLQALMWVNPLQGDRVKLPTGLKLYYEYRLQRYNYFTRCNKVYKESSTTCAKSLGLSLSSIENNYNPLLKKMGLLEVNKISSKEYTYNVYSLVDIKGWLINPHFTELRKELKVYDSDKIDYTQLLTLKHNQRLSDQVKRDKNTKHYIMSEEQRKEYIQLKKEFNIE